MKRLIPKVHLEWKEPNLIRKARDEMEKRLLSPWLKPGVVLLSTAFLMLNWWLAKRIPERTPPSLPNALAMGIVCGICLAYVFPWMCRLCPSYVQVSDRGITRVCGNSFVVWRFKDIDHCEVATVSGSETECSALVIYTRKGRRIILGVSADLLLKLTGLLTEMNVAAVNRTAQQSPPA